MAVTSIDGLTPQIGLRFRAFINSHFIKDIRSNSLTEKTFIVTYQKGEDGGQIVLEWDPSALDSDWNFTITDNVTGALFNLDMTAVNLLEIDPLSDISNSLRIVLTSKILPGDINNDGNVDLTDAILSLRIVSGIDPV